MRWSGRDTALVCVTHTRAKLSHRQHDRSSTVLWRRSAPAPRPGPPPGVRPLRLRPPWASSGIEPAGREAAASGLFHALWRFAPVQVHERGVSAAVTRAGFPGSRCRVHDPRAGRRTCGWPSLAPLPHRQAAADACVAALI